MKKNIGLITLTNEILSNPDFQDKTKDFGVISFLQDNHNIYKLENHNFWFELVQYMRLGLIDGKSRLEIIEGAMDKIKDNINTESAIKFANFQSEKIEELNRKKSKI